MAHCQTIKALYECLYEYLPSVFHMLSLIPKMVLLLFKHDVI